MLNLPISVFFMLNGSVRPARGSFCPWRRTGPRGCKPAKVEAASGLQRPPAPDHVTPPGGAARLIHPPPGEWKSTRLARGGGAARGGKVPTKGTARTKMRPPRRPLQPPRRRARCPPRPEHVYKRHAEPSSRRGSPVLGPSSAPGGTDAIPRGDCQTLAARLFPPCPD